MIRMIRMIQTTPAMMRVVGATDSTNGYLHHRVNANAIRSARANNRYGPICRPHHLTVFPVQQVPLLTLKHWSVIPSTRMMKKI